MINNIMLLLDNYVKNKIVETDMMECRKDIAETIRKQEGD